AQFNKHFGTDIGIVAQGVLVAAAIDQSVKFIAGRQRPFAAYNAPYIDTYHQGAGPADDNLSFYSGHSSAAMSMMVGMARIMQLRKGTNVGYYTLVPLGVLTSLMRIAADKHWATDVLTGMAIGSVAGWLIPTLHAD